MNIAKSIGYCSSCFRQDLAARYVDMEAYWDGPTMKQDNGDYFSIDDLVICEKCLKEAGSLIGLFPAEDIKQENAELGRILEEKNQEIEQLHTSYSHLQKTHAALTDEKIQRPVGKPKMIDIDIDSLKSGERIDVHG